MAPVGRFLMVSEFVWPPLVQVQFPHGTSLYCPHHLQTPLQVPASDEEKLRKEIIRNANIDTYFIWGPC